MTDEITIIHNNKKYTVYYSIDGNQISIFFPDEQPRYTMLDRLDLETAIKPHLIKYLKDHPDDQFDIAIDPWT